MYLYKSLMVKVFYFSLSQPQQFAIRFKFQIFNNYNSHNIQMVWEMLKNHRE